MSELPPGEYTVVGGDVDRVTVSVRVAGDDLDPDEVTRALGVTPSFAARKGDRRQSGGREVVQPTGVWSVEFVGEPEEWTLGDAIESLLARLPDDLTTWERLASRYALDAFCSLQLKAWNRGLSLGPNVLRRLADRCLYLDVDIYCNGDRDPAP